MGSVRTMPAPFRGGSSARPARSGPARRPGPRGRIAALWMPALLLLLAGCNDMYDGSRIKPLQESAFYADRQASRPLVEGTVPRGGAAAATDPFHTGMERGRPLTAVPMPVDSAVLARGRDRFDVFCSPCHGRTGEGEGIVVARGFPKPNSFHGDTLRAKPDGYYFDVITNGFGRMYSYSASIPARDRWAIVAYVRALQLSRRVEAARLTSVERERLER